ncbi:MAG: AAA family ATPase [Lachnospiraceae bacterium]|nr:AAA family ATPase [Lachnospiraceae bacterium]
MGVYLNPGKTRFQMAVDSAIFVDKTEMISYMNSIINTNQRYVSISRPRRFGKTMAADMLCAYYDRTADSRSLFENTKLAKCAPIRRGNQEIAWDHYLGQFDVLRIVLTDFIQRNMSVDDILDYLTEEVTGELMAAYPHISYGSRINLSGVMKKIFAQTNRAFVIIIDEWDAIFRIRQKDPEGQIRYLDFLREWLKDKDYVALAYMTGILPIKKYGEHSALNMFDEYSMTSPLQLARFTGFTEDEVMELCDQYGRDYQKIKDWYDGYLVRGVIPPDPGHTRQKETGSSPTSRIYALYSPLSVVKAVSTGVIQNYWNKTETYEALAEFIRKDYDGLQDAVALLMDGGRLKIDISSYQNDMTTFHGRDDVLSLLIHLGYLGYDSETKEVFIPNREILDEFKTSTKSAEWVSTFKAFERSQKLLRATWEEDAEKVAELLEEAHNRAGNKTYNDEAALSYAIQYAYYAAQKYYTTILELDTGKGYADVIFLPSPKYPELPALLIELKYNKDAKTALTQIRQQKYDERLEHYKGNLLLVSINYDKEKRNDDPEYKHHTCIIERA